MFLCLSLSLSLSLFLSLSPCMFRSPFIHTEQLDSHWTAFQVLGLPYGVEYFIGHPAGTFFTTDRFRRRL